MGGSIVKLLVGLLGKADVCLPVVKMDAAGNITLVKPLENSSNTSVTFTLIVKFPLAKFDLQKTQAEDEFRAACLRFFASKRADAKPNPDNIAQEGGRRLEGLRLGAGRRLSSQRHGQLRWKGRRDG